jgi:tetratricopeptide (TPR) repeat protein
VIKLLIATLMIGIVGVGAQDVPRDPVAETDFVDIFELILGEEDSLISIVDPVLSGAITSMEAGNNEGAVAELEDIILQTPGHIQALRLQTSCYIRLKNHEAAIGACLQIAAQDSFDTSAYVALGYLYQASADLDNAELYYSLALDKDPTLYRALFGLGWINLDRRNLDAAHEASTRITELAPDYAPNYVLLGRVLTVKGFYKEAARAFRRGFSLDPSLRARYGILLQELTIRYRLGR